VRSNIESYLDQAIEIDPDFALAYANRAIVLAMILNGDPGTDENYAERRTELENRALGDLDRALAIDPNLGVAYTVLGRIHQYNWRGAEALAAFERAIELSPSDPQVLMDYGSLNGNIGRHEIAVEYARRSTELDPNSGLLAGWAGGIYRVSGDLDAARDAFRLSVALAPNYLHSHFDLAFEGYLLGDRDAALSELLIAEQLADGNTNPVLRARNGYIYGRLGETDEAARILLALEEFATDRRVPAIARVVAYLGVGDTDRALEWLNTLADDPQSYEGHYLTISIARNEYQDPVLDRPEFTAVREKIGFRDL
jgi:tetratricopeptide (TPR) repeat protein